MPRTCPRTAALAAILLLALAGCQTPARPPVPAPEPEPAAAPAPDPALRATLDAAWQALAADQLVVPVDHNAFDLFRQVLAQQPNHPEARRGLRRIVERYLDLARNALAAGDQDRAETLLARAELVDPNAPGIRRLRRSQPVPAAPPPDTTTLRAADLVARNSESIDTLRALGAKAKAGNRPVLITAPTDADGRWMYQQMNASPGGRLRANLRLGSPASVRLQPPPGTSHPG